MSEDKVREEFEAWWREEYGGNLYCENAWRGWKASHAVLVVELPELVDGFLYGRGWNSAIGRCKGLIEAAGVRVKP